MPYGRRYRRNTNYRRKKYLSKSYIKSKKDARSQSTQIVSLQRQIKSLNTKVGDTTQWVQYLNQFQNASGSPVTLTSGSMTCFPLVNPARWNAIFQANATTDATNKFRGRSLGLQAQFILGNTEEPCPPIPVYMYVVSLRRERGQQFLNDLGEFTSTEEQEGKVWPDTGADTFVNKYYARSSVEEGVVENMNSLIYLNKGVFKIHTMKKFFIGNQLNWANASAAEDNYPSTNIRDANKMIYYKQRFSNLITPPRGEWSEMGVQDIATKDHLFCLIHYDVPTELEPSLTVSLTTLFTGTTTN